MFKSEYYICDFARSHLSFKFQLKHKLIAYIMLLIC